MTPFTHGLAHEFPWPAPAKLNLFLHITGRRADGYHLLQTVFHLLDYGDDLFFTPRGDGVIRRTDGPAEIAEHEDLVVRAARALQQATGAGLGADIRLHKRLPLGGGLGGGSSDAATTLVALNLLWNTGLTVDELARLGLGLGADVPVFVRGHSAWAEGVGEHLQAIDLGEPWYLVVSPAVAVSTAEIFAAPELKRDCVPLNPAQVVSLLPPPAGEGRDGGTGQAPPPQPSPAARGRELVCNVCEPVTFSRYPQVREVFDALSVHGAARMSGTGASCFVAFADRATARLAQETLPKQWKSFIAQGRNHSPLLDAGLRASPQ